MILMQMKTKLKMSVKDHKGKGKRIRKGRTH